MVIADARFYHYPASASRPDARSFGEKEVTNRLYFVRKNGLSLTSCYLALTLRMLMNIVFSVTKHDLAFLKRALGNFTALVREIKKERLK